MSSTTALLNKALRARVAPVLRDAGFEAVEARNGWRWRGEVISVFHVRAVGSYFSSVTGWPPGSISVSLGVHYAFWPNAQALPRDEKGRLRPAEHVCPQRNVLECGLDDSRRRGTLTNEAERNRRDLWWVEPDGSNADEVASDIAISLHATGLPWFEKCADLARVLARTEARADCFAKFDIAAVLARALGDTARHAKYAQLAEAEALRIRNPIDRLSRYGV